MTSDRNNPTGFLSKLERFTRTDLTYLAIGGSWLTFAQIALGAIAFGLSIAFAHLISKEAYGTYRFLQSLLWTATAFSLTGLPTALSQVVARGYDGAYKKSFRISFLGSLPLLFISLVMSLYYYANANNILAIGSLIIGLLGIFMQPAFLYGAFLEGKRDFKRTTLYGVALNLFVAACLLLAMIFTSNPLIFLGVYLGSHSIAGLLFCYRAYVVYKPKNDASPDLGMLTGHFSAMNLLGTVAQQIDKLIVFHYLGAIQLAIYSFAIAMPEQIKAVLNNISNLAFPKFAQRPLNEIKGNFWWRLWAFTLSLVPITAIYIFFAPFAFYVLFPQYSDAIWYSQLFGLSLILVSNTMPYTLLQAQAAKKELYIFSLAVPIFQIAVLIPFTIFWGLTGTILARIAGRLFNFILGASLLKYYLYRTRGR